MRQTYSFILAITMVLLAGIPAAAQMPVDPRKNFSPNAMSFQRYGDIPVSMYTGTPNINIPLDTLDFDGYLLPVGLSYHSGGIKAEEFAGWTGLGWTLMLGGAITREIKDIPDESKDEGYMDCHSSVSGYFDIPSYLIELCGAKGYDTEPDKFNFHFLDYHGFFMLDESGKWQVCSNKPIKLKKCELGAPPTPLHNGAAVENDVRIIRSFTLTAEGVDYVFGCLDTDRVKDTNGAIDMSIGVDQRYRRLWHADAWYLRCIPQRDGEKIEFNYERDKFMINLSNPEYSVYSPKYSYVSQNNHNNGTLISPVYLASVKGRRFNIALRRDDASCLTYTDYEISSALRLPQSTPEDYYKYFNPHSTWEQMRSQIGWKKLTHVCINVGTNGVRLKTFRFYYTDKNTQRLTLDKISISGADPTQREAYEFKYNNVGMLPKYLSRQTDHWGYYNATSGPDYEDSETDPLTTGYGVLTEIVYPTGGKTVFEFEANRYNRIFRFPIGQTDSCVLENVEAN